jgi:hypothetical protein
MKIAWMVVITWFMTVLLICSIVTVVYSTSPWLVLLEKVANPRSRGSGTRRRFLTGIQAKKDINVSVWTKRSHLSSVEALTCFAREDIDQRAYKRLCSLCL